MKITLRTAFACLAVTSLAIAASTAKKVALTPKRLAELTAPAEGPKAKAYYVEISGFKAPQAPYVIVLPDGTTKKAGAGVTLSAANPKGMLHAIRELRFPIEFEPPQAGVDGASLTSPITPTTFMAMNTGWTIDLSVKPHGKLIAIAGEANFTEAEMLKGGYGEVSGPILDEKGGELSPNMLLQPKFVTTKTHFHVFALPGETYEITLYRGAVEEKRTLKVTVE